MHRVFTAALELQGALEELACPFCFIDGLALQRWGELRFTQDADATVVNAVERDERVAEFLLSRFTSRQADGLAFALQYRVVLMRAGNGVNLDVALGAFDFEVRAAQRATDWTLPEGRSLRTCSAEDLIVHKAFAAREKDWIDVENILQRQGSKLMTNQIFAELRPLAELKEDDAIVPRLEALMCKRGVV